MQLLWNFQYLLKVEPSLGWQSSVYKKSTRSLPEYFFREWWLDAEKYALPGTLASYIILHLFWAGWNSWFGSSRWTGFGASFATVPRGMPQDCRFCKNLSDWYSFFHLKTCCILLMCSFFTLQVVEEACTNMLPNILCEYLYNLSEDFTKFYTNCQVWSPYNWWDEEDKIGR